MVLAAFSSLRVVGLRVSVPPWLLTGGLPQFLTMGPLRAQQLAPSEKAGKRAREGKQDSHSLICNLILDVICMTPIALFVRSASRGLAHTHGH